MSVIQQNNSISLLVDILDQAFDKPAWHGTNFRGSVRRLKLPQLLWRPSPRRHNIWEVTLHVAYWKYVVRRRLVAGKKGAFPRKPSNFPRIASPATFNGWKEDIILLKQCHESLRQVVIDFPESKLLRKLPKSEYTYSQLIYGASSHDLYHAGQVQLLKRLQQK